MVSTLFLFLLRVKLLLELEYNIGQSPQEGLCLGELYPMLKHKKLHNRSYERIIPIDLLFN